jgi:hypothetical protein
MNWDEFEKDQLEAKNANQAPEARIYSRHGSRVSTPSGVKLKASTSYYIYSPYWLGIHLGLPTKMIHDAINNKTLPSMIHKRKLVVLHPFPPGVMNILAYELRQWNDNYGESK